MLTVTMTVPEFTVIVAEPGAMPVASPVVETVTIDGLELDQVMVRPVSTLPIASLSVAVSCRDCPIATIADCGLTVTDAAGVALGIGSGVDDGVALGTAARVAVGVCADPPQATSVNAAKVKIMGSAKIFRFALSVAM